MAIEKVAPFYQLYTRETDHIIAALRLWQHIEKHDVIRIPEEIRQIQQEHGLPFTDDDIDTLCEGLNTAPTDSHKCIDKGCDGDIEGGYIQIEDDVATQDCYCLKCGAQWIDAYGLFDRIRIGTAS